MRTSGRFKVKFALLHGMILVAGIAVCFSMRSHNLVYSIIISQAIEEWRTQHSLLLLAKKAQGLFLDAPPFVAICTLTVLLMCFCPPRPTLRRLSRRPGFVACFTASFVILISISLDLLELWAYDHVDVITTRVGFKPSFDLIGTLTMNEQYPGCAVGAAWGLLWLGGRWRSDPSRLDALGRALGYYWLAFIFLGKFFSVGHYY
jgi:hypothetical protein